MFSFNIDRVHHTLKTEGCLGFAGKIFVYGGLYSPFSNFVTATTYWRLAAVYRRWKHGKGLRKHGVSIDPFVYRWVSPDKINEFTGRTKSKSNTDIGRIMDGDWDQQAGMSTDMYSSRSDIVLVEDHIIYQSFRDHFQEDIPWSETELIQRVYKEIESGNRCWGSTSRSEVNERCERFDELYETIKTDGYRTKRDLMGIDPNGWIVKLDPSVSRYGNQIDHVTRTGFNPVRGFTGIKGNEILIDIGRDGKLLFVDGIHRLSIAKLLDLDKVPVTVLVRHSEWVQKLKKAQNSKRVLDHPDYRQLEST